MQKAVFDKRRTALGTKNYKFFPCNKGYVSFIMRNG